jgi:hypothetical protein
MTGLTHSTNRNRLPESSLLPASWSIAHNRKRPSVSIPQILTENDPLPPSHRLIVILPDADFNIPDLPYRIWKLSGHGCHEVLLIHKPVWEDYEFFARVNLTTLAARIRDNNVSVTTELVLDGSSAQAARRSAQPGDVLVCFAEHTIPGFFKKNRLAEVLASETHLPVYTLKGPVPATTRPVSAVLRSLLFLVIGLLLMAIFFLIEIWIDRNVTGIAHTVLQILSVTVEVLLVAACVNWP